MYQLKTLIYMMIILVQNVHTNLTKSVIVGIVEAVSVPWLS